MTDDDLFREFLNDHPGMLYLQEPEPNEQPREGVVTPAMVRAWLERRGLPYELDRFEGCRVLLRPKPFVGLPMVWTDRATPLGESEPDLEWHCSKCGAVESVEKPSPDATEEECYHEGDCEPCITCEDGCAKVRRKP